MSREIPSPLVTKTSACLFCPLLHGAGGDDADGDDADGVINTGNLSKQLTS
jgi:hypothetical protein